MKAYEKMNFNENLSWCRPYVSEDGKTYVAVNEGQIVGYSVNGADQQIINDRPSNLDELLEGMTEIGCVSCPWRDVCEAMDEDA